MSGTLLCVVALMTSAVGALKNLNAGLSVLIVWGYFYGILKANYATSNGLFIFDAATVGFYLGLFLNPPNLELRRKYGHVFNWVVLLMAWPVFVSIIPIQHYLVQVIGLRGNIFWIPMILVGCMIDGRGKTLIAYSLAIMNMVAFGFALAEFFMGVELFVPENELTQIVHNSADLAGGSKRIPSIFANAHSYSLFMVATIPWIFGELLGQWKLSLGKMAGIFILVPGFICALLGIFIAGPRQPVVALGIIVGLVVLSGRINLSFLVLAGIAGTVVAYFVAQEERMQRFTELQDLEAVQARLQMSLHMGFFEILMDYPMGNGMGAGGTSLPTFAQAYVTRVIGMENEYSRIVLEQGLPGLILIISFVIWILLRRLNKADPDFSTKNFIWFYSLVTFGTAVIGIGLMSSVPGTSILMIGIGYCTVPFIKTKINNSGLGYKSKLVSSSGILPSNIPAYQRGLVKA